MSGSARIMGLMLATTVGAGLFAMPYIFQESGWLAGIFYLAVLAAVVNFSHRLFAQTLAAAPHHERLVGLIREQFGSAGGLYALLAVVGGLVFTLVIYLILGGQFLALIFPALQGWSWPIFWLAASFPVLLELKKIFASETLGALVIFVIVLAVFVGGFELGKPNLTPVVWRNFLFPLGAALFALSGWPAIKPILDETKSQNISGEKALRAMRGGTWLAALVYALFALGILMSAATISPDTLSGLADWPVWAVGIVAVLGLFAIWTSYVPVGVEIKNSLEHDLGWPRWFGFAITIFLPPFLLILGLADFLKAVQFVGGVFLASEYILILRLAQKSLRLSAREMFLSLCLIVLFALAAVYELWYFIVH